MFPGVEICARVSARSEVPYASVQEAFDRLSQAIRFVQQMAHAPPQLLAGTEVRHQGGPSGVKTKHGVSVLPEISRRRQHQVFVRSMLESGLAKRCAQRQPSCF